MKSKEKTFRDTFFSVEIIDRAVKLIEKQGEIKFSHMSVDSDETWRHDTLEEFYSGYRTMKPQFAWLNCKAGEWALDLKFSIGHDTTIAVEAPSRAAIEEVFRIFEDAAPSSRIPPKPETPPVVFIGHGRSPLWRDLKDHLHDKHGYEIEAYEIGARAGHTIRDILDGMLQRSSFALLLMTGEDEHVDGTRHARENVIHELGLFQGRLGFTRAIALLEDGASEFSNIHGIHQIRFAKGNIKETYGDVLATLHREFDRRSK